MDTKKNTDQRKSSLSSYVKFSSLGIQMIVTLCFAAWGGMKLDAHYEVKNHWFTVGLMVLAVVSSIYLVIKSLNNQS